jgi:hypothetical protein
MHRCQQTSSGNAPNIVSGTAVSTAGRTEWQVVAHEIGHNFGAIHDVGQTSRQYYSRLTTVNCLSAPMDAAPTLLAVH